MRSAVLLALLATTAVADTSVPQKIIGFRVRGKSKLTERTLGYLMHVHIGDSVSVTDLPTLQQALLTSELFESMSVTLEEAPGGVLVVADLDDKHSWIVAPTVFVLPGNRAIGAGFAENDLGGEDRKLLLYGQVGDRNTFFFGTYLDPAVHGSKWQYRFDLYPLHRVIDEYTNANKRDFSVARSTDFTFLDAGVLVGYAFQWWLVADARFRGAYQYYRHARNEDTNTDLATPEKDGWDVTLQTRLTIDARGHRFGLTWGPYAQLSIEQSVPGLDSYGWGDAVLRSYYSWALFGDHELELRGSLAGGYHLPFNEEITLGQESDLRGYSSEQFRGDYRAFARAEYSVPLFRYKWLAFRALGFYDTGVVGWKLQRDDRLYLPTQAEGTHIWRNDVGAGLRVYVKSIVLPLLGFDIGYGIEGHSPEFYFELGLTDF